MKVHVIRHPESEANKDGRIGGRIDFPPTPKGIEDWRNFLLDLPKDFKNVRLIISSTQWRALRPARMLLGELREENPNLTLQPRSDFVERCHGDLDGKPFSVIEELATAYFTAGKKTYITDAPGKNFESIPKLRKRAALAIDYLKEEVVRRSQGGSECIIVVSHGEFMRAMKLVVGGLSDGQFFYFPSTPNCGVWTFEL